MKISSSHATSPLYLHFLDRELNESLNVTLPEQDALSALRSIALGTVGQIYAPVAVLWEHEAVVGALAAQISVLIRSGQMDVVSRYATVADLLGAKQLAYAHDVKRYPAYYAQKHERHAFNPTQHKPSGATDALGKSMAVWATQSPPYDQVDDRSRQAFEALRPAVLTTLGNREDRAITFALFRPAMHGMRDPLRGAGILRREISIEYTNHHLSFGEGDIVTGVPGFTSYDKALSRMFPLHDVGILKYVLSRIGLGWTLTETPGTQRFWRVFPYQRGTNVAHARMSANIRSIVGSVWLSYGLDAHRMGSLYGTTHRVISDIRRLAGGLAVANPDMFDMGDALGAAEAISDRLDLRVRNTAIYSETWEMMNPQPPLVADVLLVIATQLEQTALEELVASTTNRRVVVRAVGSRTYLDLGAIGATRVVAVRCGMGSSSPDASLATAMDAISDLQPHAVVLGGIAFGVDVDEQPIGTILVSTQIQNYEMQRIGTSPDGEPFVVSRGARPSASPLLLQKFRHGQAGWGGSIVQEGVLLSGEKLVDNFDYRESLRGQVPDAIGGEMEASGVYAAAVRRNCSWIVVKAVCDHADGHKRDHKTLRQHKAATSALGFILHVAGIGGFSD